MKGKSLLELKRKFEKRSSKRSTAPKFNRLKEINMKKVSFKLSLLTNLSKDFSVFLYQNCILFNFSKVHGYSQKLSSRPWMQDAENIWFNYNCLWMEITPTIIRCPTSKTLSAQFLEFVSSVASLVFFF